MDGLLQNWSIVLYNNLLAYGCKFLCLKIAFDLVNYPVIYKSNHLSLKVSNPGVNIFQTLWIIIQEKFPFFKPFWNNFSFKEFVRFHNRNKTKVLSVQLGNTLSFVKFVAEWGGWGGVGGG